ncbi:MAG: hypothetical protein ACQ5SW_13225 [Sphaerochaetaceae bacterium]
MGTFDFIEDESVRTKVEEAHNDQVNILKDDLNNEFQGKLDAEVTGLKSKNDELLGEKKTLQKKLKDFDGIDLEKTRTALDFFENNKDKELFENGQVDELVEKRVSQLVSDHEATTTELQSELKEYKASAEFYKEKYDRKTVQDHIRAEAVAQGVSPEAIPDVLLRSDSIFSVSPQDNETVEARGKDGKLMKTADGEKILNAKNWIEGLKETCPHYWPPSEGAGAYGRRGGGATGMSDIDIKMEEAASKGDNDTFRALRAQKKKMQRA